jgi:hypothetical protein
MSDELRTELELLLMTRIPNPGSAKSGSNKVRESLKKNTKVKKYLISGF